MKDRSKRGARAVLGPDESDDRTFTIPNRSVTWVRPSGSRNQIEIEADPRHREILLAQINLNGANVKSVTTPAVKVREWTPQMLTKLDKDRASVFRSATMRASCMLINRVDVQQAVKEVSRFMAEPNEGAWSMLKRLVRYLADLRQARAGDLSLPGRARRVLIFSMTSTCLKLEVGRRVRAA